MKRNCVIESSDQKMSIIANDVMKKTLLILLAIALCLSVFSGCGKDQSSETFEKIGDLEVWVSDMWPLVQDFRFIRMTVDTINSAKHEKSLLSMKCSYTVDGEEITKNFSFEISYDEFLTLYNDNSSFIVYNNLIDELHDTLVTDVKAGSLSIIQKVLERDWRVYQKD